MNQTPNAQRPTLNVAVTGGRTSNIKHRTSAILWRIVDFAVAGIFIYAGALKAIDPVQFASDIDNYKLLPWPVSVALAFYLPWLEIFCALGLVFRFFYRGALSILSASIVVFTLATDCRESSRTRHHLWLFRSRQPTLEFPKPSRDESCNSRCAARASIQSRVWK